MDHGFEVTIHKYLNKYAFLGIYIVGKEEYTKTVVDVMDNSIKSIIFLESSIIDVKLA